MSYLTTFAVTFRSFRFLKHVYSRVPTCYFNIATKNNAYSYHDGFEVTRGIDEISKDGLMLVCVQKIDSLYLSIFL